MIKDEKDKKILIDKICDLAPIYEELVVERDFLIIFGKDYHEIAFLIENFPHLCGVKSNIKTSDFFKKCKRKSLSLNDFSPLNDEQYSNAERKVDNLETALNMFKHKCYVIKPFITDSRNYIFATADNIVTLCMGWHKKIKKYVPYSLRVEKIKEKHNQHKFDVYFIFSKRKGVKLYHEIYYQANEYKKVFSLISNQLISDKLKE